MYGIYNKRTKKDLSRLESLSRVIQDVDSATDMDTALRVVVQRTRDIMQADVCSVYFTEHARQRHVIVATDGLSPTVVGYVQLDLHRGLIGKVATTKKPVNLAVVPQQLDEEFVQQSGAGYFHGFLGVPITHRGNTHGVLVIRQRASRQFDEADVAFLTTLAIQLGAAIEIARASGELTRLCRADNPGPVILEGLSGAPGIAIGTGVLISAHADLNTVSDYKPGDPDAEEQRLRSAFTQVQDEAEQLGTYLDETLSPADRALFDTYVLMLNDTEIIQSAVHHIHQGNCAEVALRQTIEMYTQHFDEMEDPYLRETGADILGLGNRILGYLQGGKGVTGDYPSNTILIGRQLSAIDLGLIPLAQLRGIISAENSPQSHLAIIARAMSIPAVMGLGQIPLEHLDGQEVGVDGTKGCIYLRPNHQLRKQIEYVIRDDQKFEDKLKHMKDLPSIAKDGFEMFLYTNAGLIADVPVKEEPASAGIGLFRSELPFMLYDRFPSEQEQVEIYRQVLESTAPLPVNLRTLDVGSDKPLPYMPIEEQNPALGWRGIRLTLDHPEVFLTQLRAVLRANVGLGNLRLLLPMINGVAEVEQALILIDQARNQLKDEGVIVSQPPVGIMIEVPSAVYQAETLAQRVDFLSVGTNDLVQYLLAIDRGNPRVSQRLDPVHPAILQALLHVVDVSRRTAKPVTVCGEMASDPGCVLLLIGLGFNSLSMNAAALPLIKWVVRSVSFSQMESLAKKALMMDRPELIRQLLNKALDDAGLCRLQHRPLANITTIKEHTNKSQTITTEG